MTTPVRPFSDDLGGLGKQSAGEPIPGIGATADNAVAQDTPAATAEGEPVSPYLAARRYGSDAGYGQSRGTT